MPPPPKPAASPAAYKAGMARRRASSTRHVQVGLDAAEALAADDELADREQRPRLRVEDLLELAGAQAIALPVAHIGDAPQLLVVVEGLAAGDLRIVGLSAERTSASRSPRVALQRVHLRHQLRQVVGRPRRLRSHASVRRTSHWLPNSRSRRKASFFLSRIEGLNSAPETASSFMAMAGSSAARSTAARWRTPAPPGRGCRNPVTSGIGPMRRPLPVQPQAERGGTTERPWLGLRGRGWRMPGGVVPHLVEVGEAAAGCCHCVVQAAVGDSGENR
jgi:hypothetical protein